MGLGRALFNAAMEHLRSHSAQHVRLELRPDNQRARSMYERSGFRSVGQVDDTRGAWEVMVREMQTGDAAR